MVSSHQRGLVISSAVSRLSMYWARHTWATLARKGGASDELISEGLGHKDLRTTKIYLASFGSDALDDLTRQITPK